MHIILIQEKIRFLLQRAKNGLVSHTQNFLRQSFTNLFHSGFDQPRSYRDVRLKAYPSMKLIESKMLRRIQISNRRELFQTLDSNAPK